MFKCVCARTCENEKEHDTCGEDLNSSHDYPTVALYQVYVCSLWCTAAGNATASLPGQLQQLTATEGRRERSGERKTKIMMMTMKTTLIFSLNFFLHAFTSDLPSVFQSFRCQTGYVGVSRVSRVSRAAALESAISGCMSGTHAKTTNRTKKNTKNKAKQIAHRQLALAALAGSSLLWRHVSVLTAGGAVAAP